MRALLAFLLLVLVFAARAADDPVSAAMKLYEKRRYEQAARLAEEARFDGERGAQAQLVLGMIYLRNAGLHEAFARTAAAAQIDYLDKLTKAAGEGRSRYARLYLAEALLARGNAREAARHFERARADSALELRYRALASVGDLVLAITVAVTLRDAVQATILRAGYAMGSGRVIDPYIWLRGYISRLRREAGTAAVPAVLRSGIALDDVTFTYPGSDRPAVCGLSCHLRAGSIVAIVGEFGSGKTSLVKLLCKFYRPDSGTIRIDDVDLSELETTRWRARRW